MRKKYFYRRQYTEDLSQEELHSRHWYKELKGPDERASDYLLLRASGVPANLARKVRDWNKTKLDRFLESFLSGPRVEEKAKIDG